MICALAAVFVLGAVTGPANAQEASYEPPRTHQGHPDFDGTWIAAYLTQFERPDGYDNLVPTAEEAETLARDLLAFATSDRVTDPDNSNFSSERLLKVKGEWRTSVVAEPASGKVPYSPAGLELVDKFDDLFEHGYDNPEERPVFERCLAGFGRAPLAYLSIDMLYNIVQTDDAVIITVEDVAGFRTIHLDGEPPPAELTSYEGYSLGRWEGDTLVVRTTHMRADDPFREQMGRPLLVGPDSVVIERFTRVSDGELNYQYTIEDDGLYWAPWMGEFSFERTDMKPYEYACHEANYSLTNILKAGRVNDPEYGE